MDLTSANGSHASMAAEIAAAASEVIWQPSGPYAL